MTAKYAAIDCGSNSFRFLLVDDHGTALDRDLVTVRLGRSIPSTGTIDNESMNLAIETLGDFVRRCAGAQIAAVATSAVRDADNAEKFLAGAAATGVPVEVISGEEEGRLTFLGATQYFERQQITVLDIGGGSSELSRGEPGGTPSVVSLQTGCVRLTQQALRGEEVAHGDLDEARQLVRAELNAVPSNGQPGPVVAVAGTATTLAAFDLGLTSYHPGCVENHRLNRKDLGSTVDQLASMSLAQRKEHPSIPRDRAEVILAGAVILEEILTWLDVDDCVVSEHDILQGLLIDRVGHRLFSGS